MAMQLLEGSAPLAVHHPAPDSCTAAAREGVGNPTRTTGSARSRPFRSVIPMNSLFARYSAAIIGFGFVAVWVSVGVSAALLCLLGSAASYLGTATAQRRRLDAFTTRF